MMSKILPKLLEVMVGTNMGMDTRRGMGLHMHTLIGADRSSEEARVDLWVQSRSQCSDEDKGWSQEFSLVSKYIRSYTKEMTLLFKIRELASTSHHQYRFDKAKFDEEDTVQFNPLA